MEIDLDAPITEVTVYPERALVVRRGKAMIETAGEHTLRVSGLPESSLQRTSLRATGRGPAGTRILGIEVRCKDRKSTRLNSSHQIISYALFFLKKKITATRVRAPSTSRPPV